MPNRLAALVDDATVRRFREDGAVCIRGALAPEWVARMRAAIDHVTDHPGPMRETYYPDNPGMFFSEKFLWTVNPDFRAYVLEAGLGAIAGRLMGAKTINLFYDHLLVKEANTPSETAWHQDSNFWPFSGRMICTTWAPFDRATLQSGTLEFVQGSHAWYDRPMSRKPIFGARGGMPKDTADEDADDVDAAPPQPDVEADRAKYRILSWDVEPGDILVFPHLMLHHAPGNTTPGRRRGLAVRWFGEDVRFLKKKRMLQMIRDPGLKTGDRIDCDLFPRVWAQAG